MENVIKCLFCDSTLADSKPDRDDCYVAYNCKECGVYGFTRQFFDELKKDPHRVRKWATENKTELLSIIRQGNKKNTGLLFKSTIIDHHLFYAGSEH